MSSTKPTNPGLTPSLPSSLIGAFWTINGAAWSSAALVSTDLPCGFTDLPAVQRYYNVVTAGVAQLFAARRVVRDP